ncbi:hypothetical protein AVEN_3831-1 [Araneus ventricosus]|uniref:Uncharacterized protein n=1 Tax=Araneus ventricosus TaxID=182803 RepID=A0A4Y2GPW5_ARAVE|nr:hypothetical protein AVEN_3831-1 [Araneus ventricosus]
MFKPFGSDAGTNIFIRYNQIITRSVIDLTKVDKSICIALIDEKPGDYDNECEKIGEHREKLDIAHIRVKAYLEKLSCRCEAPESVNLEKAKLKLPKVEFVKFGREIKDWLSFWNQFSRIHEDVKICDEDKFQYLIQSTIIGSRARDIVDSYPPTAQNYAKAVDNLKTTFGREEFFFEYYVTELFSLVVKNTTNLYSKLNIMELYDKL